MRLAWSPFGCSGRLLTDPSTLGRIRPKVIRARAMGFPPLYQGEQCDSTFELLPQMSRIRILASRGALTY